MSADGFTDWNKFTLDQHCEILENEFRFSSSGIAKSVFELIEFYKKHKPSEGNTVIDTESKLNIAGVSNLAKFCKEISQQEDCPAEFVDIVNKEFWNLI